MMRKAVIGDIAKIQALINGFADKGLMLPRSLNELYENLRDCFVFQVKSKIAGCCALHICWQDLAEIKSLAVDTSYQNRGIGRRLIKSCIAEAKSLGIKKVFVLTYQPEFFKAAGFKKITHASLPHKIWAECINCHKFPDCKETALVKKL